MCPDRRNAYLLCSQSGELNKYNAWNPLEAHQTFFKGRKEEGWGQADFLDPSGMNGLPLHTQTSVTLHIAYSFVLHTYKMLHNASFTLQLSALPKCGLTGYEDTNIKSERVFPAMGSAGRRMA